MNLGIGLKLCSAHPSLAGIDTHASIKALLQFLKRLVNILRLILKYHDRLRGFVGITNMLSILRREFGKTWTKELASFHVEVVLAFS